MNSSKKELEKIFSNYLKLKKNYNFNNLKYNTNGWDSIAHMSIVAIVEKKFNINIDVDDVIEASSFKKFLEILNKYKKKINVKK